MAWKVAVTPDRRVLLDSLFADPSKARELLPEEAVALLLELTCVQSALAARVAAVPAPTPRVATPSPERRTWLTADQVAERLGVTRRWVYAHAHELEAQRLSRKCLRIPQRAVERRLAEERT